MTVEFGPSRFVARRVFHHTNSISMLSIFAIDKSCHNHEEPQSLQANLLLHLRGISRKPCLVPLAIIRLLLSLPSMQKSML